MRTPEEVIEVIKKIQKDIRDKGKNSIFKDKLFVVSNGNILFKKSFITNYGLEGYITRVIFRSLSEKRNYLGDLYNSNGRQVVWSLLPNNFSKELDSSSIPNDLVVLNFDFNFDRYKKDNGLMNERKNYIKNLLRESLNEVEMSDHSIERIIERFKVFGDEDIKPEIKQSILNNLQLVKDYQFKPNTAYGIMLGSFAPNPESKYYKGVQDRAYYTILDDKVIHDSTGDQFWLIVRNNKVTTFMLRKAIQTANTQHNLDKLNVQIIIKNMSDFVSREKKSIQKKDKFTKIKLDTGDTVKYYELSNRFETLDGKSLDADDIFDHLPEELQMKVLDMSEGINEALIETIDEEYPSTFDKDHFESLTSFNARVKYCEEHLQRISSGSSRIVYKIDNEKVLKLAKNEKGIAQNEVEIEYSQYHDISDIVARVFDYHPKSLWVEMELARKVTKGNFQQITGLDFDEYGTTLINHYYKINGIKRRMSISPQTEQKMWDDDFAYHFLDFIGSYDVMAGDLARTNSYGLVKRNGQDDIVLIDYGVTSDAYKSYYS